MEEVSELSVLHVVRLVGVVEVDVIAGRLAAAPARVESVLVRSAGSGHVRHHRGNLTGWGLTTEGRVRLEALLAAELDARGGRPVVETAYRRFLVLNPQVLAVCADWQVRAGSEPAVLNDHLDHDYDHSVLGDLAALHDESLPMLAELAQVLRRFGGYRPRLDRAVRRARSGDRDWVTKPLVDSYHTVWFELHEDLLATLGRQRSDERDNGPTPQGSGAAEEVPPAQPAETQTAERG
jgi:hypothetical protein